MKILSYVILCAVVLLLRLSPALGQAHDHDHDDHKFHFGVGVIGAKLSDNKDITPGFHLHLIRHFGHENRWGIGVGYEALTQKPWHNGANLLFNYRPFSNLTLLAGPGMVIHKHDGETEILPGFHTEAVFEFNLWGVHVGPLIGYGIDKEESHFSAGIHIGLGF